MMAIDSSKKLEPEGKKNIEVKCLLQDFSNVKYVYAPKGSDTIEKILKRDREEKEKTEWTKNKVSTEIVDTGVLGHLMVWVRKRLYY